MLNVKLLLFVLGITAVNALEGKAMSNFWFAGGNLATENESPEKITAKMGEDLTIPCRMEYNLTFFAWFVCQSDCGSPTSWEIVVKIDHGSISRTNQQKFDIDFDGALIVKDIQPSNNDNWVQCKYKKPLVGMFHRTSIIRIARESPTIALKSVKNQVVFENMTLFLECDAKGFPVPWVAWIWKDKVLKNNTDGPKDLIRRHVTTEEAGNYTCMAGNSIAITNFTYQLTVKTETSSLESKTTSQPPPTDPTTESNQERSSSLCVGLGATIPVAFLADLILGKYIQKRKARNSCFRFREFVKCM